MESTIRRTGGLPKIRKTDRFFVRARQARSNSYFFLGNASGHRRAMRQKSEVKPGKRGVGGRVRAGRSATGVGRPRSGPARAGSGDDLNEVRTG